MRVYRCDRCGEYVESSMIDFFVRKPTRGVYRFGKKMHLCDDCQRSFRKCFQAPKSSETSEKPLRNEVRNDRND